MLGLVSREKHFTLLREKLIGNKKPFGKNLKNNFTGKTGLASDEFHLLEVSLLRDMLFLEFKPRENFPIIMCWNELLMISLSCTC